MTRKQQAELEAKADAILHRDEDLLADLKVHADKMIECYENLMLPRNDPNYVKDLEAKEACRAAIANQIDKVHIVPDGRKTWIGIACTSMGKSMVSDVATQMGQLFEAQVIRHEDPKDKTKVPDYTESRKPRHEFGREKRSLPR